MLQARLAREEATRAQKATAALRVQLAAAHQERLEAGTQLELMRASSSWRITAPLRSLVRLIRRGAQWIPLTVETARASRYFGTEQDRRCRRSSRCGLLSGMTCAILIGSRGTGAALLEFRGFVRGGRHALLGCATASPRSGLGPSA